MLEEIYLVMFFDYGITYWQKLCFILGYDLKKKKIKATKI